MALAISTAGKCLGGSAFPLFMHYLLEHIGFSRGMTAVGVLSVLVRSVHNSVYDLAYIWLKFEKL